MHAAGASTFSAAARRRLLTEPRRPAAVRNSARAHWYLVAAVCLGAFMGQLDASIVTVALPRIGRSIGASASVTQWVALSYMLVLLVALVLAGALADRVGRKLLYTWGFVVFTLGSLLCGLAPSLPLLIGARVLQGLGAAMLQANSVALIRESLPDHLLRRGIGIQGAAQAIGLALGPAAGGLLVALDGWRLIFFVNVPVGIVAIVLARLLVPRSQVGRRRERREAGDGRDCDSHEPGAPDPEAREAPSVGALLRQRVVSLGLASGLISYLAMFGALFVIPYYLLATGVGPTTSGLELATLPIALGIAAPLAGRVPRRLAGGVLGSCGLLLLAGGLTELALTPTGASRLLGLALAGAGLGIFIPLNNSAILAAGPRARAGVLGGVVNMTRTLGAILGVALASELYTRLAGASSASPEAATHALLVTLLALAGLATVGAAIQIAQQRR
jgi:MFS family permease